MTISDAYDVGRTSLVSKNYAEFGVFGEEIGEIGPFGGICLEAIGVCFLIPNGLNRALYAGAGEAEAV